MRQTFTATGTDATNRHCNSLQVTLLQLLLTN